MNSMIFNPLEEFDGKFKDLHLDNTKKHLEELEGKRRRLDNGRERRDLRIGPNNEEVELRCRCHARLLHEGRGQQDTFCQVLYFEVRDNDKGVCGHCERTNHKDNFLAQRVGVQREL